MASGARNKFGSPVFEPEVFRKQMYCIEECTYGIVEIFGTPATIHPPRVIRRPGKRAPLAPSDWTIMQRAKSYRRMSANNLPMWKKCIQRARLAQRIMTYVTMQLCNSSFHIMDNAEEYWITVRGVTRSGGARGKKQVGAPMFGPEVFRK